MKHIYLKLIIAFIGLQICCIIKAEEFVIDGIEYKTYGNSVDVIGGDPNIYAGDLVIPETVVYNSKTYNVTEIASCAFAGSTKLTSVVIPNGVTDIRSGAFYGCINLLSVTIPNSVGQICGSAFQYCSNLQSVTIPNSVSSIGDEAFEYCTSLSSIIFQERDNQISVGNYAFAYCTGLPSVIMDGYVYLGEGAFYACTGLQSVTCSVPYSYKAFSGCINLQNVTLRGSSVWKLVFEDCDNIKTVTVSGKSPGNMCIGSDYPFPRKVCLTATLYVPEGSLDSYRRDSGGWGEFVDIREIKSSGVENAFADKMKVYVSGGQLALDNISVGENIYVYKLDGSMVMNMTADSSTMRITLPTNNFYVIKVADEACKVFIP